MKKLTAGIFATLLAVVSTGAANADIASSGYVDEQVGTRVAKQQETNNGVLTTSATGQVQVSAGITQAQVTGLTTALDAKANADDVYDKTTADGKFQTLGNLTNAAGWATDKENDDKYPSNAAVNAAIEDATANLANETTIEEIKTDITNIEGDVTELQTDLSAKQDKNMGAEAANRIVTTDAAGNITSSATIEATKVTGLADVATTGAYGDLSGTPTLGALAAKDAITSSTEIADGIITEADLNTTINASLDKADSALQDSDVSQTVTDGDTAPVSGDAVVGYVTENAYSLTPATEENLGGVKASDAVTVTEDGTMGIGAGAVGTTELAADAVTNANLADNAVQTENITAGAVTNAKLAADSVQSGNILDGTIVDADIAATAAIAMSKIDGLTEALSGLITAPTEECQGEGAECVLKINAGNYEWEVIKRGAAE